MTDNSSSYKRRYPKIAPGSPAIGNIIEKLLQLRDATHPHIELDGFYRVPVPEHAREHIPSKAASHLLSSFNDLNIQTVDANSDGQMDSVIHLDASNSVTVYGVANLTVSDFLIHA